MKRLSGTRDIYQMLQGTVPGLEGSSYSGVPGEGAKVQHGRNTVAVYQQ